MNAHRLLGRKLDDLPLAEWLASPLPRLEIDEEGYIELHEHGVELRFSRTPGVLETIFLFREGMTHDQHVTPYKGALPLGLTFHMSREDVRRVLGPPDETGSNRDTYVRPYDVFFMPWADVHITYSDLLQRILLVTMQLKAE